VEPTPFLGHVPCPSDALRATESGSARRPLRKDLRATVRRGRRAGADARHRRGVVEVLVVPDRECVSLSLVDWSGDPRAGSVAHVIGGLSPKAELTLEEAGRLIGAGRTALDTWCRCDPPLPHDERPGRSPRHLVAERDLFEFVLRERPRWREKALAALHALDAATAETPPPPPAGSFLPARGTEAALPTAVPSPDAMSVETGELGQLRGEVVRLGEQMAHLTALVEETELASVRKTAHLLAAVRAGSVPGTAAALDGLPRRPDSGFAGFSPADRRRPPG